MIMKILDKRVVTEDFGSYLNEVIMRMTSTELKLLMRKKIIEKDSEIAVLGLGESMKTGRSTKLEELKLFKVKDLSETKKFIPSPKFSLSKGSRFVFKEIEL